MPWAVLLLISFWGHVCVCVFVRKRSYVYGSAYNNYYFFLCVIWIKALTAVRVEWLHTDVMSEKLSLIPLIYVPLNTESLLFHHFFSICIPPGFYAFFF